MHTFCISYEVNAGMFQVLMGIPGMVKVSAKTYKTVYYAAKGFTEIALKIYSFKNRTTGKDVERYYLILRCNLGIIMGKSRILAVCLDSFAEGEITAGIQKRIHEVNEFRMLNLHKMDISCWKADRIDLTLDIHVPFPELTVFMLNMGFTYGRCRLEPFRTTKKSQKTESCYLKNKSRRINIYHKEAELNAHGEQLTEEERQAVNGLLRVEIQLNKRALHNMKNLPGSKRNLEHFLNPAFVYEYLEKSIKNIFGNEKFVTESTALRLIQQSSHKESTKAVMASIIRSIHHYGGLYELERCIEDNSIFTPTAYGDLPKFKKWIKMIRDLGISPATIPDSMATGSGFEIQSLYELLHHFRKGQKTP